MRKKMTKQKMKKNKWMPVLLVIMAVFFATAHLQPLSMTNAASKVIKLNYNKKTLKIGKQFRLKATIRKNKLKSKKVVWKSSDNLIATVTQKGLVEAKSEGYAKISATIKDTDYRASCSVVVKRNNSTSNTDKKDSMIASYELTNVNDFSENRAWVEYEDDDYKHYYGIIDTTGKLIYSISRFNLGNDISSGLSDFTESIIETEPFEDGISYYHPEDFLRHVKFGFVILDKNGNVTYRSEDGDDTTDFYILEYGGGAFLVEKKIYSLSGDSYFLYTIDKYGNKLSEELPIGKLFIRGDFEYLTDGIFVNDRSDMVYNRNTNQLFEIGKINDEELRFTSEVYDGKVIDRLSGLIIPISALQSEADFNQFKNGNLEYLPGSWYAEHPDGENDGNNDNDDNGYDYECYYDWRGGTTISDDLYYSQKHGCFYDYNGKLVFKIPDFGENVSIKEISDFTGGYAAVRLKNTNGDDYLTLLDRTGKIVYEPVRVTFTRGLSCCNGYVAAELNNCDYISPNGEGIDDIRYIGDEDVLEHFLRLRCGLIRSGYSHMDSHCHQYSDVYGNEIITRAYLTTATITD